MPERFQERLRLAADELEVATGGWEAVERARTRLERVRRRRVAAATTGVLLPVLLGAVLVLPGGLQDEPQVVLDSSPRSESDPGAPDAEPQEPDRAAVARPGSEAVPQPAEEPQAGQPQAGQPQAEEPQAGEPRVPGTEEAPGPLEEEPPEPSGTPVGPCEPAAPATRQPAGISVSLNLSSAVVRSGEPLTLEVEVRNGGLLPVRNTRGAQAYDVWVTGPDGVVWAWGSSQDGEWPDYAVQEDFMPGERRRERVVWAQEMCGHPPPGALPPGQYVAQGLWMTTDSESRPAGWWSDPVAFEVR